MQNNYCVIMAGGIGSRFWPMSKTDRPKQFIDVLGVGKSLIQITFDRLRKIAPAENIFVVTNERYTNLVKEHLPDLGDDQILNEPLRRNTAPCVAYAAYKIREINPNANMVVAPSDHLVLDEEEFTRVILKALDVTSQSGSLVTLGIQPNRPDTGYGYIQESAEALNIDKEFKKVKTFTEKPELEMAKFFLSSGDFYWNSGIFVWTASTIIQSFEQHLPDMAELFENGRDKYSTDQEVSYLEEIYEVCTNISIDYGIMEKSDNVYVLPCEFGWSDLGTWGSLYDRLEKDEFQNAVAGKKVRLYDSTNCVVNAPADKLIVLQGLNDYIVVESDNALLVCQKENEQKIKQFVKDLKLEFGEQYV